MADQKMSAAILGRELPEYYTTKSFDKEAQLQKMYGDNASRRDKRKFERYWKSDQRTQDEVAFMQNELDKSRKAWDARMEAFKTRSDDYSKALELERKAAAYDRQQQQPLSWQQAGFTSDYWARQANAYGFKTAADLKKWQQQQGLVVDGKFGKRSLAAWNRLNGVGGATPAAPASAAYASASAPAAYASAAAPTAAPAESTSDVTSAPAAQATQATQAAAPITKFDLNAFASENNLPLTTINGKSYARYDPQGIGDYYVGADGNVYWSGAFGHLGAAVDKSKPDPGGAEAYHYNTLRSKIDGYTPSEQYLAQQEKQKNYEQWYANYLKTHPKPARSGSMAGAQEMTTWNNNLNAAKKAAGFKQGGTMNRIKYFQQGGAAPQQDMQQQIVALVQAAMQGDQKATETVSKIIEAAKAGNEEALQIAQMIQQVVDQMQGQATAAKWGAKLNYIQSLKYAKGGKTCPACEKKVEMKACGGKKAKKHYFGGLI